MLPPHLLLWERVAYVSAPVRGCVRMRHHDAWLAQHAQDKAEWGQRTKKRGVRTATPFITTMTTTTTTTTTATAVRKANQDSSVMATAARSEARKKLKQWLCNSIETKSTAPIEKQGNLRPSFNKRMIQRSNGTIWLLAKLAYT